jgi:hypothetical protein
MDSFQPNNLHLENESVFSKLRFDVGLAARYSGKDFWRGSYPIGRSENCAIWKSPLQ